MFTADIIFRAYSDPQSLFHKKELVDYKFVYTWEYYLKYYIIRNTNKVKGRLNSIYIY